MIDNWSSLFAVITSIACVSVYIFFLMSKQVAEVVRPRDWLSRLRWIILAILVISIIASVPGIVYQVYRMLGEDSVLLRNVATITSQISKVATTILLVMVFTYRKS